MVKMIEASLDFWKENKIFLDVGKTDGTFQVSVTWIPPSYGGEMALPLLLPVISLGRLITSLVSKY